MVGGYCNPMTDLNNDGIWELTLEIPIGEYEYLFTTNGWDGLQGGATQKVLVIGYLQILMLITDLI